MNANNLPEIIGRGYKDFWNFKGRYRIVKGSRASKKSKTAAVWFIWNMMKYAYKNGKPTGKYPNVLVIRKVFRTLKDSCYTELKWAIHRLGVDSLWECKESPLEMTFITGQKIFFRGLDDPLKITSMTVDVGVLCWIWIEESYEITKESDFDMIDESIRGSVPDGLFKQITMTFNPWNEKHWIKKRFFDTPDPDVLAITTNYQCNEWLDDADRKVFETMKKNNPRRFQVAGLGNWGVVEGLVYENFKEQEFKFISSREFLKLNEAEKQLHNYVLNDSLISCFGLDFGYTNDPSALFCGMLDLKNSKVYVFDEMYEKGLSNRKIAEQVKLMGYGKEQITADSAEPKSIDELRGLGLRVSGAKKGKDSIQNGIQWIQDFEIIVHPRCNNFLTEISNYTFQIDRFGTKLNVPIDDFNHLMDAMRYALEKHIAKGKGWLY